jgi:hypothetical protein
MGGVAASFGDCAIAEPGANPAKRIPKIKQLETELNPLQRVSFIVLLFDRHLIGAQRPGEFVSPKQKPRRWAGASGENQGLSF